MGTTLLETAQAWPALPLAEWRDTYDTVHMWTQIVGKTRLELTPLVNHFWNVVLYVTPRGLTTSSVPYSQGQFEAEFDFISHRLVIANSNGQVKAIELYPRSVADFYSEYMSSLRSLGIEVTINTMPQEFPNPIPFEKDTQHAAYDKEYVDRFRRALVASDRVLQDFRSRFIGKSSPVQFFWGSFDLALSRFNGKLAPPRPGADRITREAYSHEDISCGFWPGDDRFPHPAYYAYAAPKPNGLETVRVMPDASFWDNTLGEFLLRYEDVRMSDAPEKSLMDFCQSTYNAAATLGDWERTSLERA